MIINADSVRFLLSRLSKTDCPDNLGPPILIQHLPAFSRDDVSLCPLASLEDFLEFRRSRGRARLSLFSFFFYAFINCCVIKLLRWAFRRPGIIAPPSSTHHVSVLDAFNRGAGVSGCLAVGDWTGVGTFFRHYLQLLASG